jgi:hypothetical protein
MALFLGVSLDCAAFHGHAEARLLYHGHGRGWVCDQGGAGSDSNREGAPQGQRKGNLIGFAIKGEQDLTRIAREPLKFTRNGKKTSRDWYGGAGEGHGRALEMPKYSMPCAGVLCRGGLRLEP